MSAGDNAFAVRPEKKLRFRSGSKIHFRNDNKSEEIFRQIDGKGRKDDCNGNSKDIKRKPPERNPSLLAFLQIELTRGYLLEHDEERFSARREKVYSFMKIPKELEKFMVYGFFQCADSLLFVYTFLPLRFIMALWSLFSRPIRRCLGLISYKSQSLLKPAETCDLLKGFILIVCCVLMCYIDTNMMYHVVKSQSVMKLYIFYNMLEVADRLFSALGQDTIDALFWTATEPRDRKREHVGVILHLIFALVYVFFHSILVLFQATTLNVAFNSNNKSLLIIMMSNNFVELKGSVFKKFDKNNLFQVSCSDVRERLHLFVLLFVVVLQTMKEYLWKEERFWVLLPDCMIVLVFEVIIDWIKHAFITRFNEIPSGIYKEYNLSLAYDVAQTRQKHAFTDHSDLVARRMGFIPLPLGVVIMRILLHAVRIDSIVSVILVMIGYACLAALRILVSIVILGKACDLIDQHKASSAPTASPQNCNTPKKETNVSRDSATSPTKPEDWGAAPELQVIKQKAPIKKQPNMPEPLCDATLGAAAIFSNSAVDLNGVCCLNEKLLIDPQIKQELSVDLLETEVSRSEPDIKCASDSILEHHKLEEYRSTGVPGSPRAPTPTEGLKKRSESTPNLVKTAEGDSDLEC